MIVIGLCFAGSRADLLMEHACGALVYGEGTLHKRQVDKAGSQVARICPVLPGRLLNPGRVHDEVVDGKAKQEQACQQDQGLDDAGRKRLHDAA